MGINFIVEFEIFNPKLISVNDQYMHPVRKTKSGRYVSYVCKSPSLKDFQAFYNEVLKDKITDDEVTYIREFVNSVPCSGVQLSLVVGIPFKELYDHDASNFIKALEDCISSRLGVDDSKNLRVVIEKEFTRDKSWWLSVKICPYVAQQFVNEITVLKKEEVDV